MLSFLSKERWSELRKEACKNQASKRLSDYASPDEIADIKSALIVRFKRVAGLTAEDIRFKRSCIRQALRQIDKGLLPTCVVEGAEDLLAPLRERYEAAKNATLILDDEWSRELQRQADLQARFGTNNHKETHL